MSRTRVFTCLLAAGCMATATPTVRAELRAEATAAKAPAVRVLLFVGGGYHDYDEEPRQLAKDLSAEGNVKIEIINDLGELDAAALEDCDVLMIKACIEKGLSDAQREAIVAFLRKGKGLVAVHCAMWCFQDWPEFRKIVGGLVLKHAEYGPSPNVVVYREHPICNGVPDRFGIISEPYFVDERAPGMCVLVQTDQVYEGREGVEPQVWTTRYGGGYVYAITYGHDRASLADPVFLRLLGNGIQWAAGRLGPATTLSELERKQGFVPLFDGKSLDGWTYDPSLWQVKDGIIIGNSHPDGLEANSFAITERSFGDFILRFSVQYVSGNSGVQFRSHVVEGTRFEVGGYQADVVLPFGWGNLHEQNGRRRLVDGWKGKADRNVNGKGWNEMEVECRGPRIVIRVNGIVTADWTETDDARPKSGIIALQLHRGDPMEVRFTNIRIKPDLAAGRRPR